MPVPALLEVGALMDLQLISEVTVDQRTWSAVSAVMLSLVCCPLWAVPAVDGQASVSKLL